MTEHCDFKVGDIVRLQRGNSPLIVIEITIDEKVTAIYLSQLTKKALDYRNKFSIYITKHYSHFTKHEQNQLKDNTMNTYILENDYSNCPKTYKHIGTSFDGYTYMLQSQDGAIVNLHISMIKKYIKCMVKVMTLECKRFFMIEIHDSIQFKGKIHEGKIKVGDIIKIPEFLNMLKVVEIGNLEIDHSLKVYKPEEVIIFNTTTLSNESE